MKIKNCFEDYKVKNIGKTACIELEVAAKHKENKTDPFNKEFPTATTGCKYESNKIIELRGIHLLEDKKRIAIYRYFQQYYKDKFPVWADTHLSWWVHFHAFFRKGIEHGFNTVKFKINSSNYVSNFLSLPLYAKIRNKQFFVRPNGKIDLPTSQDNYKQHTTYNDLYLTRLKTSFRTNWVSASPWTNNNWHLSLEFRMNNVLDTRLYWYYIWQLLLAEKWIILKRVLKPIEDNRTINFSDSTTQSLSNLTWTSYTDEEFNTIKENFKVLLKVLRFEWFKNTAKHLHDYWKENLLI